jgi:hypothetical protein
MLLSEQDKRAQQLFNSVINPMLRLDSGAATPEQEVARYSRLLPNASDNAESRLRKMEYLDTLLNQTIAFAQAKGIPIQDLLAQMRGKEGTWDEAMASNYSGFNASRGGPRQEAAPKADITKSPEAQRIRNQFQSGKLTREQANQKLQELEGAQ